MIKKSFYFFMIFCLFRFSGYSQTVAQEYTLKAIFIYNFTRYIEWNTLESENEFTIGVIGDSPINEELAQIARSKTVKGKKIILRKFNTPDEISFCHILFISNDADFPLNELLEKAADKGALIISEQKGYAAKGTAINFFTAGSNTKFEVNTKSINSAGLKASSELLKHAIIIE